VKRGPEPRKAEDREGEVRGVRQNPPVAGKTGARPLGEESTEEWAQPRRQRPGGGHGDQRTARRERNRTETARGAAGSSGV